MIALQAISFLFAYCLARHNAEPVSHFEFHGTTPKQMKIFHRWNNWTKFFFCCLASSPFYPAVLQMLSAGVFSFLWIYLVFDPVLNRNRSPKKPWDYLGLNDGDGRFWNGVFGRKSGKWKAFILTTSLIAGNIIYQIFLKP
jgi:hypothetical protein